MSSRSHRWASGSCVCLLLLVALGECGPSLAAPAQVPAANGPSKADAERMQQKLDRIAAIGLEPRRAGARARRTVLPEREMNAYLRLILQPQLPTGVIDPSAVLIGDGQFAVRVIFDLDVVRGQRERGMTDPLRYVGGRVPVSMDCVLRAREGLGTLEFRSATMSGLPIPKFVVQELVSYATRSPDMPNGFRFDEPFPLPATIREVHVTRGEAVVIQ